MNLINELKKLIIKENIKRKDSAITLFSKVVDGKLIQLKSTYHQRQERFGAKSYDELVDIYKNYLETRRSKYQTPPRIAVPDQILKKVFEDNLKKIQSYFSDENPENGQLIFVKKRENEDEKNFDYIEFLIKKEGNFYYIITSSFSQDGQFLKTREKEKKSKRVTLEFFHKQETTVIYL
jgi:hypothetical protein